MGDLSMVILAWWYMYVSGVPFSLLRFMHYSFSFFIDIFLIHALHSFTVVSSYFIYCSCVAVIYCIRYVALISHSCSALISHSYVVLISHSCSTLSLLVWNIPDQSIFLARIKTSTQHHVQKIAIHALHSLIVHASHSSIIHESYIRPHAH